MKQKIFIESIKSSRLTEFKTMYQIWIAFFKQKCKYSKIFFFRNKLTYNFNKHVNVDINDFFFNHIIDRFLIFRIFEIKKIEIWNFELIEFDNNDTIFVLNKQNCLRNYTKFVISTSWLIANRETIMIFFVVKFIIFEQWFEIDSKKWSILLWIKHFLIIYFRYFKKFFFDYFNVFADDQFRWKN